VPKPYLEGVAIEPGAHLKDQADMHALCEGGAQLFWPKIQSLELALLLLHHSSIGLEAAAHAF